MKIVNFFSILGGNFAMIWTMAGKKITSKLAQVFTGKSRPPMERFYIYGLIVLIAYASADLTILKLRPEMLPTEPPPKQPEKKRMLIKPYSHYFAITERNIFNSDGKIPPALSSEGESTPKLDAPAVLSRLPLQLIGTIVHSNPKKSVASILVKAEGQVNPYMVDDDIERMATITLIERRKVTFRNLNSGILEYIEIPSDLKINIGLSSPSKSESSSLVNSTGQFKYSVNRTDVDRMLDDLPSILKEARMDPNYKPGSGGKIDGFVFKWIKPGSIYEQLGFKVGDTIHGANGVEINNPAQAMEALSNFRNSSSIQLNVTRGGKNEEFEYDIR